MEESILTSIKLLLGIPDEVTDFDKQLIMFINEQFMALHQMNIGPTECYKIIGKDEKWSNFTERTDIESVKNYIYYKVRLSFDPPTSSIVRDAITKCSEEAEFRLRINCDKDWGV